MCVDINTPSSKSIFCANDGNLKKKEQISLFVCRVILSASRLSLCGMTQSRKGGEPFSLAGNKCTSLFCAAGEELFK